MPAGMRLKEQHPQAAVRHVRVGTPFANSWGIKARLSWFTWTRNTDFASHRMGSSSSPNERVGMTWSVADNFADPRGAGVFNGDRGRAVVARPFDCRSVVARAPQKPRMVRSTRIIRHVTSCRSTTKSPASDCALRLVTLLQPADLSTTTTRWGRWK